MDNITIRDILDRPRVEVSNRTTNKFEVIKAMVKCFNLSPTQASDLCSAIGNEAGYKE